MSEVDILRSAKKNSNSNRDMAKERLKYILTCDRINLPAQFVDMIKVDLIRVLSDYAEIDEEGIEIVVNIGNSRRECEDVSSLVASIPIRKIKSIGR